MGEEERNASREKRVETPFVPFSRREMPDARPLQRDSLFKETCDLLAGAVRDEFGLDYNIVTVGKDFAHVLSSVSRVHVAFDVAVMGFAHSKAMTAVVEGGIRMVFDLIELLLVRNVGAPRSRSSFIERVNDILNDENVVWRLAPKSGLFLPLTDQETISRLDSAPTGWDAVVADAWKKSLSAFSSRPHNLEGAALAAAQALEAAFHFAAERVGGKCGDGFVTSAESVRGPLEIHPTLLTGAKKLYAWRGDAHLVAHPKPGEPSKIDLETTLFVLSQVSSWLHLLRAKLVRMEDRC